MIDSGGRKYENSGGTQYFSAGSVACSLSAKVPLAQVHSQGSVEYKRIWDPILCPTSYGVTTGMYRRRPFPLIPTV